VAALGLFALSAGFAVATLKTALIDHPLLRYPAIGYCSGARAFSSIQG
jgi:hypothetical protein